MSRIDNHDASIVLTDAGLTWPDGSVALHGLTAAFGPGRTGLVGTNGSGKSTLLRLVTGELRPTTGSVTVAGDVGYLAQNLALRTGTRVADLLGVGGVLDALRAIEAGSVDPRHFDTVGDDWDVETRAAGALRAAGVDVGLDRPVGRLSGGETVLLAVAGLWLLRAPVTLLDEPTNNLDREHRGRLLDLVGRWPGALVVVSHDIRLLEAMDDTAELHAGALNLYGGPWSAYREQLGREQAAAVQAQRSAEQVLRTERRQRVQAETTLARRARYARTDFENKRRPKIVMNTRKSQAQVSAGRLRTEYDGKVEQAARTADDAAARVRRDDHVRLELPDPGVPAGRRLAEIRSGEAVFVVQGPERVALTGANGAGKTALLETLVHPDRPPRGPARATALTDRIGYLPQRLDGLDDDAGAVANVLAAAPAATEQDVRDRLARFLIRGDAVTRPVRSLSGGERFRVALARLLLADPPPQLLVLDEPSNNLDLATVDQLVEALAGYRGGLLVVSHDDAFLARLGIGTRLELAADGGLRQL